MKNKLNAIILAIAITACASVANAVSLTTDTLADLVANNGSLSIGDKTFTNFTFNTSGLTGFDAANIVVTASVDGSGVYYLTYGGNITLASSGPASADLLLNYRVTASAGAISMIDQLYTGSAQPAGGSFLSVDETVRVGSLIVGNSHLQADDLSDPFAEPGDNLNINPPQGALDVTKDIAFGVTAANGGFVTISQVSQSFHQTVPDGGMTVALLGGALVGLQVLRRKLKA